MYIKELKMRCVEGREIENFRMDLWIFKRDVLFIIKCYLYSSIYTFIIQEKEKKCQIYISGPIVLLAGKPSHDRERVFRHLTPTNNQLLLTKRSMCTATPTHKKCLVLSNTTHSLRRTNRQASQRTSKCCSSSNGTEISHWTLYHRNHLHSY